MAGRFASGTESEKMQLLKLVIHFTNTCKKNNFAFFSAAAWPTEFQHEAKVREFYHGFFENLASKKTYLFNEDFLKVFLSTARSEEYLTAFCMEKIKSDARYFDDKPVLAELIDKHRHYLHPQKTNTRKMLDAHKETCDLEKKEMVLR